MGDVPRSQPERPFAPGAATTAAGRRPAPIDARGPRFGQALTGGLSLLAFLLDAWPLVVGLAIVLTVGALGGDRTNLWAWLYRTTLRPRLGAPAKLEDPRPPRFSTTLGALFLSMSAVLLTIPAVAWWVAWAPALAVASLAILAATTGLCVGCQLYVSAQRWRGALTGGPG